jgi:hypothetical protein|tara:strand:- start:554 stop:799 length:246 start_codon:yes stop_codon:yes gene_type:complete
MPFSMEATLDVTEEDTFTFNADKKSYGSEESGYVMMHLSCNDSEFCSEVCVTINIPALKRMMSKCGYVVTLKPDDVEEEEE